MALVAGFTEACAGTVVPTIATTAVAAIARRIKEVFLIDEFSIFFLPSRVRDEEKIQALWVISKGF
jgi:hypothetical protein